MAIVRGAGLGLRAARWVVVSGCAALAFAVVSGTPASAAAVPALQAAGHVAAKASAWVSPSIKSGDKGGTSSGHKPKKPKPSHHHDPSATK